jgi:hypothetical protein
LPARSHEKYETKRTRWGSQNGQTIICLGEGIFFSIRSGTQRHQLQTPHAWVWCTKVRNGASEQIVLVFSHFSHYLKRAPRHPTNTWKVPGSELWIGVKGYVQYKRCYQQIVCLHDNSTIYNCSHWYYLSPHWLKPEGCECPCFPKNVETYYGDSEFEDEDWSSSNEEGMIGAYSCKNKCLFYAYAKTGKYLKEGEMVLPYIGPIPLEQPYDIAVTGRVQVTHDKIMHKKV